MFDHVTDSPLPAHTSIAGDGFILVFDGIFLHRAELRDVWDLTIFLDASFDVTIPRGAAKGPGWGSPDMHAPSNQRHLQGQRLYLRENEPQKLANFVIDYTDLANPIVVARRWPKQH
jgi:uridine kinase